MKYNLLNSLFFLLLLNISFCKSKIKKNILIIIFPGGQHKNIYMISLLDFSINNNEEYDFNYDIIIHISEKQIWENSLINNKNKQKYNLYTYGSISDAIEKYDLDDLPKQNLFKFYQLKLRLYNQDFLDSDIITSLKESRKKYSLLITDRPNYISIICSKELLIENKMYLSLRPFPQLFYQEKLFVNSGFIPTLGSEFTNLLTFKERCTNFYNFLSERILNFLSNYEIKYLYNAYDYIYVNTNNYFYNNTIILIQYPIFLTYPISFPPHIIPINPITLPYNYSISNIEKEINIKEIEEFLKLFKNNFILSKEILHQIEYNTLTKIVSKMNGIGFIYLYDTEERNINKEINNLIVLDYKKYKFDSYEKVLYYLLKKNNICGIITNSNFNEIILSIYYSKPVISFGNGIYQQNIKSYIKKNSIGLIINNDDINNYLAYIEAINKIKNNDDEEFDDILNNIYKIQCKKMSELLKLDRKNPGEEFNKWLNYGMKNKYDDLRIFFYENNNFFVINNLDIITISIIIILISSYLLFIFLKQLFCPICCFCCCGKSSKKEKIINDKNKIKKD